MFYVIQKGSDMWDRVQEVIILELKNILLEKQKTMYIMHIWEEFPFLLNKL